jgi:hypothetical protein
MNNITDLMYGKTIYSCHTEQICYCDKEIHLKGALKATEHRNTKKSIGESFV